MDLALKLQQQQQQRQQQQQQRPQHVQQLPLQQLLQPVPAEQPTAVRQQLPKVEPSDEQQLNPFGGDGNVEANNVADGDGDGDGADGDKKRKVWQRPNSNKKKPTGEWMVLVTWWMVIVVAIVWVIVSGKLRNCDWW